MVASNPELQQAIKDDPVGTLRSLSEPLDTDPWIYRIVVASLGIAAILVVIFTFLLVWRNNSATVPDALVAIGSAAIAALAALLVPQHR